MLTNYELSFLLFTFAIGLALLGLFYSKLHSFVFWLSILIVDVLLFATQDFLSHYSLDRSLFIFSFNLITFVFEYITSKFDSKKRNYRVKKLNLKSHNKSMFSLIGMALLSVFFYVNGSGGIHGILRSWVEIATTRSTLETIQINVAQILFLYIVFLGFQAFFTSKKIRYVLFVIIVGLIFSFLARAKVYLLPIVIPLAYHVFIVYRRKPLKLMLYSFFSCLLGILIYFSITVVRWSGELNELNGDKLIDTIHSASEAGFERNLGRQFDDVFDYYNNNEHLYGDSYLRIFNPIIKGGGYAGIENPMYKYFVISDGESGIMRGSAHPSIYGDSFANFGFVGIFVGVFWIFLTRMYSNFISNILRLDESLTLVLLSYSIPIVVRGSVYYGTLYLLLFLIFLLIPFFFKQLLQGKFYAR